MKNNILYYAVKYIGLVLTVILMIPAAVFMSAVKFTMDISDILMERLGGGDEKNV